MSNETSPIRGRLKQKVSDTQNIVLHPETDSDVVLIESADVQAKNVRAAIEEISARSEFIFYRDNEGYPCWCDLNKREEG